MNQVPTLDMSPTAPRASIVDVFENFLGGAIDSITESDFQKLTAAQASDLVAQLDLFLEAASREEYPDDAVTLDGFASPIIIPYDRSEPRTTRRAKQVSLVHSEVIIPLQEVSQDYSKFGSAHLSSLGEWARRNEKLLRAHVLSLGRAPELLDLLDLDDVTELADWLMENLARAEHRDALERLIPDWQRKAKDDLLADLSPIVYSTMADAIAGGVFRTGLSFTQETAGRFYQFCAGMLQSGGEDKTALFSHTALLRDLELPAIDDLKDEDFVGIRMESGRPCSWPLSNCRNKRKCGLK